MKFKYSAAALALSLGVAAQAHAADLTVDYGSTAGAWSVSDGYQVVEAGNAYSDTPRTTVFDSTGTIIASGAPLTTSNYAIDLDFTTTSASLFSAAVSSNFPGAPVDLNLYSGITLVEEGVTGSGGTDVFNTTLNPGAYTLSLTGTVDSSKEAEGGFEFFVTPTTPVSAAPEPSTWLLMFVGVGFVGGALRMRRGQHAGALAI